MSGKKSKTRFAGRSLNLILWFAFSLFALILLMIFMAVQSLLVGNRYRAQTLELMERASEEMSGLVADADTLDATLRQQLTSVGEEYEVTFRFLSPDGRSAFSDGSEAERYPQIAEDLKSRFTQDTSEVVIREEGKLAYATLLTKDGRSYFLYLTSSVARLDSLESTLRLITLVTALFSVVLAFAVSGVVAMLITKPVTEVTEQAKELARGQYEGEGKKDYFCLELSELSEALDYARSEISKTDTMQKELIANVSHDFKTPLTMIKAYASMIREISGDNKAKRDTHAQIIIDETDRLTNLVNDVLDLSKLRAGAGDERSERFDLSALVFETADRFRYLSETQGYTLETSVEAGIFTEGVRARVGQVIYNLIGNAVTYTGEDRHVRIRLFRIPSGCRFEVEDTGKGIPEEEKAVIWERYYRSNEAHKRPVGGTGLGLSIVKSILVAKKCPFGVESEEGKGSVFWVEFPEGGDDMDQREQTGGRP